MLLYGYAFITLLGAFVLSWPVSNGNGEFQNFLDALFVATSGISTSGLTPVDIGTHYSLFGQIVLFSIFQIGGIGYMSFIVLLMSLFGWQADIRTGILAKESLAGTSLSAYRHFFISVLKYTIAFELAGALLLTIVWIKEYPLLKAFYYGLFHSVSAFCTAGFGLYPDSLMKYRTNMLLNYTVIIISLLGGIGFFVIKDIKGYVKRKISGVHPNRISVHSKLALTVTILIIGVGTTLFVVTENFCSSDGVQKGFTEALFQSVSASTTDGFNSIDISKMSSPGLVYTMFLMFVGASPGSTGGGIKTTTFGLLVAFFFSILSRKKLNLFEREIVVDCVHNAFIVLSCFIAIMIFDIAVMSATEKAPFLSILFEIVSALGNTGLSMGITSSLSPVGKALLIATMFIGRVGPLSIAYAIVVKPHKSYFSYPKTEIFVG